MGFSGQSVREPCKPSFLPNVHSKSFSRSLPYLNWSLVTSQTSRTRSPLKQGLLTHQHPKSPKIGKWACFPPCCQSLQLAISKKKKHTEKPKKTHTLLPQSSCLPMTSDSSRLHWTPPPAWPLTDSGTLDQGGPTHPVVNPRHSGGGHNTPRPSLETPSHL